MADATFDAIKIGIASPDMIRSWSFGHRRDMSSYEKYRKWKIKRKRLYL